MAEAQQPADDPMADVVEPLVVEEVAPPEATIPRQKNDSANSTESSEDMINLAKRISMAKRPCIKDRNTGELKKHPFCSFGVQQFQQFGIGVYLYFKFLRQLTKLFFVLFLLSTPLFLSCLSGKGLEKTPMKFEQTTVGNLGDSVLFPRIHYPDSVDLSGFSFLDFDEETHTLDKRDGGMIFAWSDLLGTLIFLLFLYYVAISQEKEAIATDDANTTIADYTICVKGLPRDCYNREELQNHFQKKLGYGQVVDVAICYNDTGIIRKYLEKSAAMENYQRAIVKEEKEKKLKSLEKKRAKTNIKLANIKRKYSKHCICAYITFDDAESVKQVMYDYPRTFLARLCMKEKYKFRNQHKLRIYQAAEPSEIIYDNMKYSKCNVFMRRSCTLVLSFIVIAASCGMSLIAASYRQSHLQAAGDDADACPVLDPADALAQLEGTDSDYDNDCLCSQISYSDMNDNFGKCEDYMKSTLISNVLIGGSAIIIIVINIALKGISRLLVNFEKHTSLTKMERELTWKMFVGLFFNTALIILCVNAKFDDLNLVFLFEGEYEDFHPGWYEIVGVSLLLTMIMNTLNPHVLPLVLYPFQQCALWCKIRKILAGDRITNTQRELNEMFEGIRFTLAERYAIICNTIYVAFFYSSGMPVLLLMASATFLTTYVCDKFVLLKRAKTPPAYNVDIAQFAVTLIKPVVYIHLAVAVWVYGSDTVLLSHPLENSYSGVGEEFREKVLNYSSFPAFLALCVLLSFDIIKNILTTFRLTTCVASIMKRMLLCICPCCCKKCIKLENAVHVQENIRLFSEEMAGGTRFESYLVSFQELYDQAYFNLDMAKDTKGLLVKEEPLYVKQNLLANLGRGAPLL